MNWPKKRPWGWYATLIRTPWFCIKVLKFNSHSQLSLQKHKDRLELWFFLRGVGTRIHHMYVRRSKLYEWWLIKANQWHQFRTFDKEVYVIEFQFGKRVSEEDIERI